MATARRMLDEAAAGELPNRSEDIIAQAADQSTPTTSQWLDAGASLTSLWVEQTQAQISYNFETLQQLLGCRDWRTWGKVQQAFVEESVARLNQTLARHRDLTGALMTELLAARATDSKIEA